MVAGVCCDVTSVSGYYLQKKAKMARETAHAPIAPPKLCFVAYDCRLGVAILRDD
jgi:hypothetical protein